jgi:hypothetical protein
MRHIVCVTSAGESFVTRAIGTGISRISHSHLTFASRIHISYRDYLLTPDALERVTAGQSEVFRTRNDCLISTILYALAIVSVSA